MSNIINEESQEFFKLLTDNRVAIVCDISDDLKCVICKNLLNDAHTADCGCNFCSECVENHISNIDSNCPGNGKDCEYTDLSTVSINHNINKKISHLIAKCCTKSCLFETELINMKRHIQTCSKRILISVPKIVGSDRQKGSDNTKSHLKADIPVHNNLLLEMINSLKEEINYLRKNDEENKREIKKLKEDLSLNNGELKKVINAVTSIKMESEFQRFEMETRETNIKKCETKINSSFKKEEENKKEIHSAIDNIKENLKKKEFEIHSISSKVDLMKADIKHGYTNEIRKLTKEINNMCKIERMESIDKDVKSLKINIENLEIEIHHVRELYEQEIKRGSRRLKKQLSITDKIYIWDIGIIDQLEKDQYIHSDYFYDRKKQHKMGLRLYNYGDRLDIWLKMYTHESTNVDWPFKAKVTVKIALKYDQNKSYRITKHCIINESSSNQMNRNNLFIFYKSDLSKNGIPTNTSFSVVECAID